jgi:hypothetical protein
MLQDVQNSFMFRMMGHQLSGYPEGLECVDQRSMVGV